MSTRKTNRQSFGNVRQLPSARWQARYRDQAGRPMTAPMTFETKRAALDHLATVQADRMRGVYRDHRDGAQLFGDFASDWIENGGSRGRLAPRTSGLYQELLATDLAHFAPLALAAISPAEVRRWYSSARREIAARAKSRGGTGDTRLRQSYALLRSVMGTAARDRLIGENPCTIAGAGVARSPERPHMPPETLAAIVADMPPHYAVPLQTMFGAHLRLGELIALQRGDFDPSTGSILVERQAISVDGEVQITPTKTGTARPVTLPPSVAAMLVDHLARSTGFGRSPMFTKDGLQSLTRSQLQQAWRRAAERLGLPKYHLHDIRHSSLTTAAQAGATTRELMARAGHRTSAAAMIYQHVAEERNAVLADRMDALAWGSMGDASGTPVARGALPLAGEHA